MHSKPNADGDDIDHGHASPSHDDNRRAPQCDDNGRAIPRSRRNANGSVQPPNNPAVTQVYSQLTTGQHAN